MTRNKQASWQTSIHTRMPSGVLLRLCSALKAIWWPFLIWLSPILLPIYIVVLSPEFFIELLHCICNSSLSIYSDYFLSLVGFVQNSYAITSTNGRSVDGYVLDIIMLPFCRWSLPVHMWTSNAWMWKNESNYNALHIYGTSWSWQEFFIKTPA